MEDSVERVLISDFGLARTVDDATLTRTGIVAGTPHYMSPEQASGQSVDYRSDLFSLGSVIYFMCTGRPPFRAQHALAVLNRICHDPHRPVDEVNHEIPAELAETVDQLLAKRPSDRFKDAHEVGRHLESILAQLQQGQRFHRRRWKRLWVRWRTTVRNVAAVVSAVVLCVLMGVGLASLLQPSTRSITSSDHKDQTTQAPSPGSELSQTSHSEPAVHSEPTVSRSQNRSRLKAQNLDPVRAMRQDPFYDELFQIQSSVAEIEARLFPGGETSKFADADGWHDELRVLQSRIQTLEISPANSAGRQQSPQ